MHSRPQRFGFRRPFSQSLRAVECENFARARLGITSVGETRDDTSAFVDERQPLFVIDPLKFGGCIGGRLILNGRDLVTPVFGFCLNDSNGASIDEQDIIGGANVSLVLANGNALPRTEVEGCPVLNMPARLGQTSVDLVARYLLRILVVSFQWTFSPRAPRKRSESSRSR
jgi:hypothetical protein